MFALTCLIRLLGAAVARPLPGLSGARERYPRVFDVERHFVQLLWAVFPRGVQSLLPGASLRAPR